MPDRTVLLDSVIGSTIAPQADQVDRAGTFPRAGVTALGEIGLLGLASAPGVGGGGGGLAEMARVIDRLAGVCGSTAMVLLTHYAATAVVEAHGPPAVRGAIARGTHLTTLALAEPGPFWVPQSIATSAGGPVVLDGGTSWVTAAGEADSYVWSSRSFGDTGPMTLWLVGRDVLRTGGPFDGVGLRGCAAAPVVAQAAEVPPDAVLGADGEGLDIVLTSALPVFFVLAAAFSLGLLAAMLAEAAGHLRRGSGCPESRAAFAGSRTRTDLLRVFLDDTVDAVTTDRPDATVRAPQAKLVATETGTGVGERLLRLCGIASARKELALERHYRDALTARVMTPTTEVPHDFLGRIALGRPLFRQVECP